MHTIPLAVPLRLLLRTIALVSTLQSPAGAQMVTGVVFADLNGNGAMDAHERGLARVAVSNQDTVVLTDEQGAFRMHAGPHGLVFVSVPDGHRVSGTFWRRADTARFALTPLPAGGTFTFVHASDTHVSVESAPRLRLLRAAMDSVKPAFVLITGDLVRDALRVPEAEARGYYDLFMRERSAFTQPVYTVPGNHEIFGIERARSGVDPAHPLIGKQMYRSYLGPEYYSFTYGGVHFVALATADVYQQWYRGHVDSLQLAWLQRDLARLPPGTPVVTFNHIPFYSTAEVLNGYDDGPPAPTLITVNGRTQFRHTVSNAADVLTALAARRHVLALGGHVHMRELIDLGRAGPRTRFENAAAIVAPVKTGIGTFPSGFTVYTVRNGEIDAGRFVAIP